MGSTPSAERRRIGFPKEALKERQRLTTIKNKTKKPLSVPLPGGKKLFLGPGKSGQIASKSADHEPLLELVKAGDLEIVGEDGGSSEHKDGSGSSVSSSQDHTPSKPIFRSGDR